MGHRNHSRQLHVWLTPEDVGYLHHLATLEDETISCILRRLIRSERAHRQAANAEVIKRLPKTPSNSGPFGSRDG